MAKKSIEAAKQMRVWCDNNYKIKESGDLTEQIKKLGVSQSTLNLWFLKLYGTTPGKHIVDLRVRDAMRMIRNNSTKSIDNIAIDNGFTGSSHLDHAMKNRIDMGVFEYRRWVKMKAAENGE